jgi:hypothetical protein
VILELKVRFDHAALEPAHRGLRSLDVLFAAGRSDLQHAESGLVIFLGDPIRGFGGFIVRARPRVGAEQAPLALELGACVREPRFRRSYLPLSPEHLFGSLPPPQRLEPRHTLVELPAQGLQAGAELVLPELGDHPTLRNLLTLPDR